MPRLYQRKPDALKEKITVPLSADLLDRLKSRAEDQGRTTTATARALIEQGLSAPAQTGQPA